MKLNLSFLAFILPLAIVFTSCKKDKDGPGNYFTYEGKTYETNYAQSTDDGGYANTVFTSMDISSSGTSGKLSAVNILFGKPEFTTGTFTYKEDSDPVFDDTKNFFDAVAVIDVAYSGGSPDMQSGTFLESITAGTVTISKDGSNFNVSYELNFNGKIVSGKYSGAIKMN